MGLSSMSRVLVVFNSVDQALPTAQLRHLHRLRHNPLSLTVSLSNNVSSSDVSIGVCFYRFLSNSFVFIFALAPDHVIALIDQRRRVHYFSNHSKF